MGAAQLPLGRPLRRTCLWPLLVILVVLGVPAAVEPQTLANLPVPRRCHLAAPCDKHQGCQPEVDSKERWVDATSQVQFGVVCISASGARLYGMGGFFSYSVSLEGSNSVMYSGKFNQYDIGLQAHLSPMMDLALGTYTVTILEGQLASRRVPIADGKPYRVHSVPLLPPKDPEGGVAPDLPTDSSMEAPLMDETVSPPPTIQSPDDRSQDQNIADGDEDVYTPTEVPSMGETALEEPPNGSFTAVVIVSCIAAVSVAVFVVGLACHFSGRKDSAPEGFTASALKKGCLPFMCTDYEASGSHSESGDPEMGHVVGGHGAKGDRQNGQRRPARRKRSKDKPKHGPAEDEIETDNAAAAHPLAEAEASVSTKGHKMVTIAGPRGHEGIKVSQFTARLLASNQALPGMFVNTEEASSTTGRLTKKLDWAITPGSGQDSLRKSAVLQPLDDDGTDTGFRRRYEEAVFSSQQH